MTKYIYQGKIRGVWKFSNMAVNVIALTKNLME